MRRTLPRLRVVGTAEPPKPEPKEVEAPKKTPPKKTPPKKRLKKKKRRAVAKKKKPAKAPPKQPAVQTAPAPLVLSNVSLGGGIAVVKGEEDIFGDPESSRKGIKKAAPVNAAQPAGVSDDPPPPPKKRKKVLPKPYRSNPRQVPWPPELPRRNEQFVVNLLMDINDKGRVTRVTIAPGSGVGEPFDTAARKFCRKLRFTPGTGESGKPRAFKNIPWQVCWNCKQ